MTAVDLRPTVQAPTSSPDRPPARCAHCAAALLCFVAGTCLGAYHGAAAFRWLAPPGTAMICDLPGGPGRLQPAPTPRPACSRPARSSVLAFTRRSPPASIRERHGTLDPPACTGQRWAHRLACRQPQLFGGADGLLLSGGRAVWPRSRVCFISSACGHACSALRLAGPRCRRLRALDTVGAGGFSTYDDPGSRFLRGWSPAGRAGERASPRRARRGLLTPPGSSKKSHNR